ncbi:MAG: AMP-binding protein [Minicystis sp.]
MKAPPGNPGDPLSTALLRWARDSPERPAIIDERESLTHATSLERALALAAAAEASSASRIALLCDHDSTAILGWIGLLLAGKTVVPLCPTNPGARLAWMLADAEAGALLASPSQQALARSLAGDSLPLLPWRGEREPMLAPVDPAQTAYLLYTSGSTGEPKAVIQSRQNLLQHMHAYGRSLDLGPEDRLSLLPSFGVDAGLMDIFGALLHGASLHLRDLRRRGLEDLPAWLISQEITVLHTTPTVFRGLMAETPKGLVFPRIRRVVLGGEPARPADLLAFNRHFHAPALLVNGYGPTEHTVGLQAFFPAGDRCAEDPLPIGQPVEGVEVLLLDDDGRETADEGEIALRSLAVALGYWHRPDLDRKAFLPDPQGGERRLYRTGDRGRRRPEGGFAFLGRRDDQIKLHGQRIELGEIEAALRAHPGVAEAVVSVETSPLGEPSLTAHALASQSATLDTPALLSWLRDRLPASMVPAEIQVHTVFPRTSSGKVDRQALRSAVTVASPLPLSHPLTTTEAWLTGLFREVLGACDPRPESSFFALGGHSLLAARLLSRVRARFRQALSPALIFEHPTLGALAAQLDALPEGDCAPPLLSLSAEERSGLLPLSFAQERLWFLDCLRPGNPVYHVPLALRLEGPLDLPALSRALAALVQRHEALRTQVELRHDRPLQRILPPWVPEIEIVSLLDDPPQGRLARALIQAGERAQRPFDLRCGAPLRASLFTLGERESLLLIVVHHFAADGWAGNLLLTELGALYSAFSQNHPSPLDAPPLQPVDVAHGQRGALGASREEALTAAWRDRLSGAIPLDLPLDRPRPLLPSHRGHRGKNRRFTLSPSLEEALRALGARTETSLFMIFLSAFALLLSRRVDQDDIVLATAGAGRPRPELEGVVGTFVNTLLLRLDLQRCSEVRALLDHAREVVAFAQRHEELPFERLVAALHPERLPGREPLFQAMILFHQRPPVPFTAPDLLAHRVDLDLGTSLCDLTLTIVDEGALRASFEYDTDLFDEATLTHLEAQFLGLLAAMTDSLDRPLRDLPLVSPEERRALLEQSTGPRRSVDFDAPLHAAIEAQAEKTPDAPAVVLEDRQLFYRELLTAAREIAAGLRPQGIGRGTLVPVLSQRSLDLVPTWLGILLTGAAFVPLDPSSPPLRLDAARGLIACPLELASSSPGTEDPVYGFFTSGSTGTPKLTLIPRRGINNRFAWMNEAFGPTTPITLATTSPFFDSAVWQLLWPLTRGGTVILPPDEPLLSARELLSLIERHRVTILDFVPSVLEAVIDTLVEPGNRERLRSVEHVVLGGEAIKARSAQRLQAALPQARISNLYGPTEASIGCIAHTLSPGEGPEIPIGKPISNVTALLLDRHGRLVPPGAAGEITLGGACVGLGYHGDPDGSARAFPDNPFPELESQRLYRTGDRARRRADGALLFLGRMDEQVKIRGQRIDPREIERALEQHPEVREAAVERRVSPGGEAFLLAHLAPGSLPADLEAFLRDRLPTALIPRCFRISSFLPRSAAGKIDRRALSALPFDHPAAPSGETARNALETHIAAAWASVLGVTAPPIDAGFFDLGGNSLQMAVLAGRLERGLGREIPLITLFQRPTIRAFAAWIAGEEEPLPEPEGDPRARAEALRRLRARRAGEG